MKISLEKFEAFWMQLLSSHRIYFYPFPPYFTSFFKYSCRICFPPENHFIKQLIWFLPFCLKSVSSYKWKKEPHLLHENMAHCIHDKYLLQIICKCNSCSAKTATRQRHHNLETLVLILRCRKNYRMAQKTFSFHML